jgi:hypothetical protein
MDSNLSLFHFIISNLHSIPLLLYLLYLYYKYILYIKYIYIKCLLLYLLTNGVFIGYLLYKNSLKLSFYMGLYNKNKANFKKFYLNLNVKFL